MCCPPTLGVLLAGGLARRMGGGDKPLKVIAGRTILERALERLAPQCDGLILNANGDPARFARLGLPVVPDDVPGFAGPLSGILAALDWTAAHRPGVAWVAERRRRAAPASPGSRAQPPTRRSCRETLSRAFMERALRPASRSPARSPAGALTPPMGCGLWRCATTCDARSSSRMCGKSTAGRPVTASLML